MKVNVFAIASDDVALLREKLESAGMSTIRTVEQKGWAGDFYYSPDASPRESSWVAPFRAYFTDLPAPQSHSPFAVFLFTKDGRSYALSYGKAHFYVRPFCDYDFGIELAKRIAEVDDTRLTASKRFSGRQRKAIRSYSSETRLSVESGESVDYVQAAVLDNLSDQFGSVGKFGTSAQLALDISAGDIGQLLDQIDAQLARQPRFSMPRTTLVADELEIARLDKLLLDELQADAGVTEFTQNSYDLYGVDFVFGSTGRYTIKYGRRSQDVDQLTMLELKNFIAANDVPRERILNIKIAHHQDDGPTYVNEIKRDLDFIADDERVVLTGGRWMRFNQDYLDYLDDYLRAIKVEPTEPQLLETTLKEGDFNASVEVAEAGYEVADKDFSIFKTRSKTPIEAWDLKRGSTVYAVKFGTAQKLGYVCDQAMAVVELLRNKADVREIPEFDSYCLWLGYRGQKLPASIADTGSIILKQKIEAWARATEALGLTPLLKLSRRLRTGVDDG
ncbi:DUF6119 family protein [Mycolicibacterium fortuitum]